MKLFAGLIILISLFSIFGCNSYGGGYKTGAQIDSAQKSENNYIDKDVDKEKQAAKVKLSEIITGIGTRIDSLEKDIQKTDAKEKKRLIEEKTGLEKSRDHLNKDLGDMDKKMGSDWKDFKSVMDRTIDSVKNQLE